jgi:hypothetical protein
MNHDPTQMGMGAFEMTFLQKSVTGARINMEIALTWSVSMFIRHDRSKNSVDAEKDESCYGQDPLTLLKNDLELELKRAKSFWSVRTVLIVYGNGLNPSMMVALEAPISSPVAVLPVVSTSLQERLNTSAKCLGCESVLWRYRLSKTPNSTS